ncbi:hypothetical protein Vretimale_18869 [Volvox reticuliferus]|uniref:Glucosamine inositolphosphorylceramide transferase 1 N-terminal domain-containing protein n=1 Tax=Volvox reticuliferus TaxID=1737510 RepID=A0A8J4LYL3_9CHLO|nr:hypothetical protein Vretifemale_18909 [Volvox reticuliferus]GIM16198.1 hypothetical protein Vretimale_18869 [Volvox reticuliferus]
MDVGGEHAGKLQSRTKQRFNTCVLVYIVISLGIALVLFIDPLVDRPSGLIKLRWFSPKPLSHGLDACSWDYEGSWKIGFAKGAADPLNLNISSEPVLTCANLVNRTAVSFVADPFLFIPPTSTVLQSFTTSFVFGDRSGAGAGDGDAATANPWFAFYEMKNLERYIGELGVAVSFNGGTSWHHLGTALSEPFHLSFPHVLYDNVTGQYLMFAETSKANDGAIRVYGTSEGKFPFGWELVERRYPDDRGWPATRRWFQFGARAKYVDTAPVWFENRWWIFTTRVGSPGARQPKYTLLLYTADTLLGEWRPHPRNFEGAAAAMALGGRVPFGIDADARSARSGGRPFVHNGTLYRWAQDCSRYYGEALLLMRADVANDSSYAERVAVRYEPRRDARSWNAERLHHADVQRMPDGSWVGLVDGDRYGDGTAHFIAREQWFVQLKALLLHLVVLQLVLVGVAVALLYDTQLVPGGWRATAFGPYISSLLSRIALPAKGRFILPCAAVLRNPGGGYGGGSSCYSPMTRQLGAVAIKVAIAVAVSVGVMALFPRLVYCPRWPISVPPFPSSPHYVPDMPYVDPAAPYNVTDLAVVTGCSATFMDRLENLVASLQYWAPNTRVVVYDMGFTSDQLGEIRCWTGIELRRFPWERYPSHVRDLRTYAFKGITFELALQEVSNVVLWLDCGLELRGPLTPVAKALAANGHVSVQQSNSPGGQGYPNGFMSDKYVRRFFNFSDEEYERIKDFPYCAGGFQGFVRGSEAHKRILDPLVACSLDPESCIAPPGHDRGQHCYDQTAGTLLIRHNNFSSCLPRELYATSSTRKVSYDPRSTSSPIVVASRRYRQPKPYKGLLRQQSNCSSDPSENPWRTIASEHTETTISHASLAKTIEVHMGALADFAVQSASCLGLHVAIQLVFWIQVLFAVLQTQLPLLSNDGMARRSGGAYTHLVASACIAVRTTAAPVLAMMAAASITMAMVSFVVITFTGRIV